MLVGTKQASGADLRWFHRVFFSAVLVHFAPSILHFRENYGADAFRVDAWNTTLFSVMSDAPEWVGAAIAVISVLAALLGILGWQIRINALLCFFGFYCLASANSMNVGAIVLTDVWAILIITGLFYRADKPSLCRRLILIQIFAAFFAAGLQKLLAGWPIQNDLFVFLNAPPGIITRKWVSSVAILRSEAMGEFLTWSTVLIELFVPILALFERTRRAAGLVCICFFVGLIAVMDVPWLFFLIYGAGALLLLGVGTERKPLSRGRTPRQRTREVSVRRLPT